MSRFKNRAGGSSSEGSLVFIKPADLARAGFKGVVAEGELVGTLPNSFNEDKEDFKILADTPLKVVGIDRNEDRYEKEIAAGDTIVINGCGNLNYLMKSVGPGDLCQIVYQGKSEIQKGKFAGTEAHTFEVAYGEE